MKKKILSILLLGVLVVSLTGCGNKGVIVKDKLDFEIDSEVKIMSLISEKNEFEIINKDDIVDTSKIGKKEVTIKYIDNNKEKEQVVKINVVDTTKPTIEYKKELTTTEGIEIDLLENVKVSDNSKEDIVATVMGEYDINKAGNYNLKYVAVDSSNNKTEEEFTLIVKNLPTLTLGKTYYNKDNMNNGGAAFITEITLNEDMSVKSSTCAKDAGCTEYLGNFTISGSTLTIILNKYQDVNGSWRVLPKEAQESKKCTIVDDNIFINNNVEYVIK